MRTLNEQIQRLRDALVTCYNAIKRKGGTIPEAGERTLLNMPAAVLSIPQTHGVMTELNVTANGEYLPSDYDADGFSKVTARFDTSSLPKMKVSTFKVTNDCINEDGRWEGEDLIDFSECLDLTNGFYGCSNLVRLDVSTWNLSKLEYLTSCFFNCKQLIELQSTNWNTNNIDSMLYATFTNCSSLERIDTISWHGIFGRANHCFDGCVKLRSLIWDRTIGDVVSNEIKALPNFKGWNLNLSSTQLDTASILALVNGLADLTGQTEQTLTLGSTIGTRLNEELIAGMPAKDYLASKAGEKNWTIAY